MTISNNDYDLHSVMGLQKNINLSQYSSWRCGGFANYFFRPRDKNELCQFMNLYSRDCSILWLGLGSNILFRDGGVDSVVVLTAGNLSSIFWDQDNTLYAECGATCAKVAREAAKKDFGELAFLAGIPGTLGGALKMNAGAIGSEIWSFVTEVEVVDMEGRVRRLKASEYKPFYRGVDGPELQFLGAWLRLSEKIPNGIQRIKEVLAERNDSQPTGQFTCGSVFKNPVGHYAGELIEKCDLKGFRLGDIEVSKKHANFFINHGDATSREVENLIRLVKEKVNTQFSVWLEEEVQILGKEKPHE
jgi:UDP-N-acetylmuramate dehydrogenase